MNKISIHTCTTVKTFIINPLISIVKFGRVISNKSWWTTKGNPLSEDAIHYLFFFLLFGNFLFPIITQLIVSLVIMKYSHGEYDWSSHKIICSLYFLIEIPMLVLVMFIPHEDLIKNIASSNIFSMLVISVVIITTEIISDLRIWNVIKRKYQNSLHKCSTK